MESPHPGDQLALERVLFFSDAVFAIAITLLALEIKVPVLPHGSSDRELGLALTQLLPRIVGFVISFFLIGQTWVEHHRIGRLLLRFDRGLLWKNLRLLFYVAAMPFATALHSEYFGSRISVTFYALVFTGLGMAKAALWRYVVRQGLVDPESSEATFIGRRVWATPLTAAAVAVAGGLGFPYAVMGFMFIPLVARLLDRSSRLPVPARA